MKKAICAVAVMMVLGLAGQAMAAGGKTLNLEKDVMRIAITEKAGNWDCDCDCFPEEPPTEFNDWTRQVCHCKCSLADGSSPGFVRTEEKVFQIRRPKK